MRYFQFKIVEGYKEVADKFSQEADPSLVQDTISKYKDLVNRNQVQGNERNIDWWSKQGWQQFQKFVNAKSQQPSQNQQKKRKNTGKSHTLAETDQWLIVIPLDKDASCFHGKGTDWCTTKPEHDYFEKYFRDNSVTLIYFLQKQTGNKWAIAVYNDGSEDYFDIRDNEIGNGDFADQTGIPLDTVMKYVNMVSNKNTDVSKKANNARSEMKTDLKKLESMINELKISKNEERSPEIETLLFKTKSPELLKNYLYIVANDEDTPVPFEQSMQTLIALKAPSMMVNVSNISEKSVRLISKNFPSYLKDINKKHPELVRNALKNNPAAMPRIEEVGILGKIDYNLQKIFIEKNALWIIAFEDNLHPKFEPLKAKVIGKFFEQNSDVYAIVVEPGLTDLSYLQVMPKEEYQGAVDTYREDAFEVVTRDNLDSL